MIRPQARASPLSSAATDQLTRASCALLATRGSPRRGCHVRLRRAPQPRGRSAPRRSLRAPSPLTRSFLPFRRQLAPLAPFLLPSLSPAPSLLPLSPLPSPLPRPTLSPPPPRLPPSPPPPHVPSPRPARRSLGRTRLSAGRRGPSPHRKPTPRVSSATSELGPSLPKSPLAPRPSAPRGRPRSCAFAFSCPQLCKSLQKIRRMRERNHSGHNRLEPIV